MKIRNGNNAVTELIGAMILLLIAVAVFAAVFYTVVSNLNSSSETIVDIVGKMNNGYIVLEHRGGEPLDKEQTNIIFTIGGYPESHDLSDLTVKRSDGGDGLTDGFWDIGEILYYIDESWYNNTWYLNAETPRIEVKVGDETTFSLVMMGTLQEGYLGMGGIWHFDECDPSPIVNDSSGHWNIGYLRPKPTHYDSRPKWINLTEGAKKNCALNFSSVESRVEVYDSWSLDIEKNITVEAWFRPFYRSFIDEITFDNNFGLYPNITHVVDNIYAIVYRQGTSINSPGTIKTIEMLPDGTIISDPSLLEELDFETSSCYEPKIIHIDENIVAVAYSDDSNGNLIVKTLNISSSGNISHTTYSNVTFNDSCSELNIEHIANDMYCIVYGGGDGGNIITFDISSDGEINNSVTDIINFDNNCEDVDIISLFDDMYSVAYISSGTNILKTFNISSNGTITYTNFSIVIDNGCDDPDMVQVSNNVIAVAYEHTSNSKRGTIKTFNISSNGSVTYTNNSLIFEDADCQDPDTIHLYDNTYGVAYEGPTKHIGKIAYIDINFMGNITSYSVTVFDSDRGVQPNIIKISNDAFIIVYKRKSPHPGALTTFMNFNTSNDYTKKGIAKIDSYGIYANSTHVFGFINDRILTGPICDSNTWVHVALTYNQEKIILYCNADEIANLSYSSLIEKTGSPLLFGPQYYGYIDEIAVYDEALSQLEIEAHYTFADDLEIG